MKPAKQKLVVVLGMHRSGTSAITRGLQVLSVSLGDRLLGAAADNVKGFWEDRDILHFNEKLLASIDRNWCSVTSPTPGQVAAWRHEGLVGEAAKLLRGKMAGVPCFGIKDPRLALLLPFWQLVFADLDLDVRYLVAFRHPASVARSLAQRNGISLDHGHLLWLGHVMGSLTTTLPTGCLVVGYGRVLQAPEAELQRMASFLDLEIDAAALHLYRNEFLDPSLQHHHDKGEEMPPSGFPYSLIAEVHAILAKLAVAPAGGRNTELAARCAAWLEVCAQMAPVLSTIDTLGTRMQVALASVRNAQRTAATAAATAAAAAEAKVRPVEAQLGATQVQLAATQIELADSEVARLALEERIAALMRLRPLWRRIGSRLLRHYRRLRNA